MSAEHPYLGGWMLLKAPPETCPECAVKHGPNEPHNQQSLTYQFTFYGTHGRWPTWTDAMAHCTPDVQARWRQALIERGVEFIDTIDVPVKEN